MSDAELNLRTNTLFIGTVLAFLFSWMTPYAWWVDGFLMVGNAVMCSVSVWMNDK